ncbi:hypothetical protein BDZ85DRAFT_28033 [Elsinoe ampelina]|uniref:BTB domain-containing protein n=1 Tax=Elsinoe ampelina TaxID=302913 RepID=A0A6A6G4Q9_9PEZI|nr:hypothetical protein BDZ85DRAFT_28033 [Elsinoe ampelina]
MPGLPSGAWLDTLHSFYNNTTFSDVTIAYGKQRFSAHKVVLASNSQELNDLLVQLTPGHDLRLQLHGCNESALTTMLNFFYNDHEFYNDYTNDSDCDVPELIEFHTLAVKYRADKFAAAVIAVMATVFVQGGWIATDREALHEYLCDIPVEQLGPHYGEMATLVADDYWLSVLNMPSLHEMLKKHPELALAMMVGMKDLENGRAQFDARVCEHCGGVYPEGLQSFKQPVDEPTYVCGICGDEGSMVKW